MYSRYNKDKTCLSSKTPTCLISKTLTFILYDLINHPNIMGTRRSCGKLIADSYSFGIQLRYVSKVSCTNLHVISKKLLL